MITNFEVGAALTVATSKFDASIMKSLDLVSKLTESFERLRGITTGMFSESGVYSLNRSLLTTERRIGAVTGEVEILTRGVQALAAAGAEATAAMGGIAVTGGGGGRNRTVVAPIGGMKWAGPAAAGGLLYGVYEAANMQSFIARALISSQIPIGPNMMQMPQAKTLQDIVTKVATSTGMSFKDTEQTALEVMRGMEPRSFAEKTSALPAILRFAAQEQILKGVSPEESAKAAVGLAHQTTKYSPDQISAILPAFARLSMAAPGSLSQLNRALSYDLPYGTSAAGVDPMILMAIAASGQQIGLNTKSGTWVQAMMSGLMPHVAGLTSHAQMKKIAGLSVLGLVDKSGESTVWDKSRDSLDLMKALEKLRDDQKSMPHSVFAAAISNAFGTQGGRAAMQFSTPTGFENLKGLIDAAKNQPSTETTVAALAENDPKVEFNIAIGKLTDQLISLGNTGLPLLTGALTTLNSTLDSLKGNTPVEGAAGAVVTAMAGKWGWGKLFGKGVGAAGAADAVAGAGLAADVTLAGVVSSIVPLAVAALVGAGAGTLINWVWSQIIQFASSGKYLNWGDLAYGMLHHEKFNSTAHPITRDHQVPRTAQHQHGINIQHVSVHMPVGADLHAFAVELHHAASRTVSGYGSLQSPYLSGLG